MRALRFDYFACFGTWRSGCIWVMQIIERLLRKRVSVGLLKRTLLRKVMSIGVPKLGNEDL